MASKLALRQYIELPPHPAGDFDPAEILRLDQRFRLAHPARGSLGFLHRVLYWDADFAPIIRHVRRVIPS